MFFAKSKGKRGEIYVYEAIGEGWFGGITAKSFADTVKSLGKVDALDIYINSPGGSVFDGIAIFNQIKRFDGEKVVHIDGIAASIASVIAMAGDEIHVADNGMLMIHDPWGFAVGTSEEMRKYADSLDKVRDVILDTYVAKTGGDRKEISEWMAAETWMNADECMERGFCTKKVEEKQTNAHFSMLAKFKNTPEPLRRHGVESRSLLARMGVRTAQMNRGPAPAKA